MAAVTIVCRGVKLQVDRDNLLRAPLLLNACGNEADDMNEEVSFDRDPEAVRMVLEYCTTGVITQQMLTDDFFAEVDYFGVAPQLPLLQPLRDSITYEELCYDAGIFVERLINTNMRRMTPVFSHDVDEGFVDPEFKLLIRCERYEPRDRWGKSVDAFKYAEAHPDILRTVAFRRFGVSLTWRTWYVDIFNEEDIIWEDLQVYPRSRADGRYICTEQSWKASTGTVGAGQCRLGYTATDTALAKSSIASDHSVITMQYGSTVTLQCSGVAVEFRVASSIDSDNQGVFNWLHLNIKCDHKAQLVPMLATVWSLTDQNSASWSAAVAGFTIDTTSSLTAYGLDRLFNTYMATLSGEQRAMSDAPACAAVIPYVRNGFVHNWKIRAGDQPALASRRIGVALYAAAGFSILGFEHRPVNIEQDQKTLMMGVCEFTVRTLGVGVPK
jgi:BTB/POZ domain